MDFKVVIGYLGPKRGFVAKMRLRESGHEIGLLAKMGTGKGLLDINLEECARKGIGAKMRLIQGKDVVLEKEHLGRSRGIWGQNRF